ncbi:MAG: ribosome-associated translation inhibitor RaiA [Armatimonadetes bacterium]|nr:ribosome-associated translation inhibitor RaiA [Armatimonadota bacterium]
MELLVRNAEGNVSKSDREYAAKKLGKLQRYFNKASKVEMVHTVQKGKHRLEVTVFADEFTIRGEERDQSIRACVDKVSEKLERRLRRLKGRLIDAHRRRGNKRVPPALLETRPTKKQGPRIVERKRFHGKMMSEEEAALQMELLDHAFFAFRNRETGRFAVLYRRKDGDYGLLEPEV